MLPPLAGPLEPPVAFMRRLLLCVQPSGRAANTVMAASTTAGEWSRLVMILPVTTASLDQRPYERKKRQCNRP